VAKTLEDLKLRWPKPHEDLAKFRRHLAVKSR